MSTTTTAPQGLALAADEPPSGGAAARRAFVGVLRLEWRRQLLTPRVLWPLLLAGVPVVLTALIAWLVIHFKERFGANNTPAEEFANLYHALIVRVVLFFGALALFVNLVRGEVEERTFHYLLLTPVRRWVLIVAKYVAAVGTSWLLFGTATVLSFLFVHLPGGIGSAFTPVAFRQLATYLAMTMLGCMAYGGIFLAVGTLLRSPGLLVAVLYFWEWAEPFLPPLLKQVSVVHYLKALTPVPITEGPFALLADPTPTALVLVKIALYVAVTVSVAAWSASRTDLDYGKG